MSDNIILSLNGNPLELTPDNMRDLAYLQSHPAWDVVKRIFAAMEAGTRTALESVETPLDKVRGLQGRLSVVADLRLIVDDGVMRWVEAQSPRKDTDA